MRDDGSNVENKELIRDCRRKAGLLHSRFSEAVDNILDLNPEWVYYVIENRPRIARIQDQLTMNKQEPILYFIHIPPRGNSAGFVKNFGVFSSMLTELCRSCM